MGLKMVAGQNLPLTASLSLRLTLYILLLTV